MYKIPLLPDYCTVICVTDDRPRGNTVRFTDLSESITRSCAL